MSQNVQAIRHRMKLPGTTDRKLLILLLSIIICIVLSLIIISVLTGSWYKQVAFDIALPLILAGGATIILLSVFLIYHVRRQLPVKPAGTNPPDQIPPHLPFHHPGQMATILMSAMDAIITVNSDQKIILFNAAAETMFGLSTRQAIGQKLDRLIPPRYRDIHRNHIKSFGATNVSLRSMRHLGTLTAIRSTGEEFPIEASISQSGPDQDKLFTVILRDISERLRAEEQIRELNKELEVRVSERTAELAAVIRNLESFSSTVSHDLRAPLRHITGFTNLLIENNQANLDPDGVRHLEIIRSCARRMEMLIDDLLAFARSGTNDLVYSAVNMNRLVDEVRNELLAQNNDHNIKWIITPLPDISADGGMMKLVWSNLISNAMKFSQYTIEPVIEIGHHTVVNSSVTYFVRDNGAGFDPAKAGQLFTAFQRLHRDEEFEGTGVGLANVRRIIERHGGDVRAEGNRDQGATFYFTLPAQKPGTMVAAFPQDKQSRPE